MEPRSSKLERPAKDRHILSSAFPAGFLHIPRQDSEQTWQTQAPHFTSTRTGPLSPANLIQERVHILLV